MKNYTVELTYRDGRTITTWDTTNYEQAFDDFSKWKNCIESGERVALVAHEHTGARVVESYGFIDNQVHYS